MACFDSAAQALDQLLIPSASKGKGKPTLMRAMECFNTKEIYPCVIGIGLAVNCVELMKHW